LGYQRGKRSQHPSTSLLQIDSVINATDAAFYCGKRVAYVYRTKSDKAAHKTKTGKYTKVKCIWGKITRPHGNSGNVRAKFAVPLPPRTFGATCRIMLYPSNI
jgi:large subunit ribosomal protein L35Ae